VSLCAAWLCAPAQAHAQNVVIAAAPTTSAPAANEINYVDCIENTSIDFTLTISDASAGDSFEVWVGPPTSPGFLGCVEPTFRTGTGACWPLANPTSTIQGSVAVTVRAQDIAGFLDNASPPKTYVASTGATSCQQQTTPGPISLGIYFLLVKADGTVDGNLADKQGFAEYSPLEVGTLGPNAPSNVNLVVNDGYATLSWTPSSDTSIVGYNVYCQDYGVIDAASPSSTGDETADTGSNIYDAGAVVGQCGTTFPGSDIFETLVSTTTSADSGMGTTIDAAVTDSASTTVSESGAIVSTVVTPAGISLIQTGRVGNTVVSLCASPTDDLDGAMTAGTTASSATLTLTNYDYYVFAVAAVDSVGNVGPVGDPLQCGTPGPISDFWYAYTKDGGLAGGGYCALEGVGMPAGGACMGIGVGFVAIGLVRRRRKISPGTTRPGRRLPCPRR
jgi:hypothetical protein